MQKEDYALNVIFLCQKYILPLKLPLQLLNDPFRWNGNTESKIYHTSTNTNTCRTRLVHVARAGPWQSTTTSKRPGEGKNGRFWAPLPIGSPASSLSLVLDPRESIQFWLPAQRHSSMTTEYVRFLFLVFMLYSFFHNPTLAERVQVHSFIQYTHVCTIFFTSVFWHW